MRKNDNGFVDYKHLKACVSIIMVLDHYGWLRELKGAGNTVRSICPIHNGSNDKQFVVNIRNCAAQPSSVFSFLDNCSLPGNCTRDSNAYRTGYTHRTNRLPPAANHRAHRRAIRAAPRRSGAYVAPR